MTFLHAPGPDEQIDVEAAHRRADHGQIAQIPPDDVADGHHRMAGGGEAAEGDAHAAAEPLVEPVFLDEHRAALGRLGSRVRRAPDAPISPARPSEASAG